MKHDEKKLRKKKEKKEKRDERKKQKETTNVMPITDSIVVNDPSVINQTISSKNVLPLGPLSEFATVRVDSSEADYSNSTGFTGPTGTKKESNKTKKLKNKKEKKTRKDRKDRKDRKKQSDLVLQIDDTDAKNEGDKAPNTQDHFISVDDLPNADLRIQRHSIEL